MNAVQAFFLLWRGLSGRPAALCRLAAGGHLQDNNLRSEVREKNANLYLILVFLQRLHYNGINKIWCLSEGTESIMNVVLFVIFSSLEYLSVFFFLFALFRFEIKEQILNSIICSVIMSFVSHMFMLEHLSSISSIVQFFILIFFLRLLLRTSWFYSSMMLLIGYIVFALNQTAMLALLKHYNVFKDDVVPYTNQAFLLQGLSCLLLFLYTGFIRFNKGGFSFIEHDGRIKRNFINRSNVTFFVVMIISIIITFISNYWIGSEANPPLVLISFMLLLPLLFLIYLSVKKETADD